MSGQVRCESYLREGPQGKAGAKDPEGMSRAAHPQTEKRKGFTTKVLKAKNKGAQSTQTEKGAPSGPRLIGCWKDRVTTERSLGPGVLGGMGWRWAPRAKGQGSMVEHLWVPIPPPGGWWSGIPPGAPHFSRCHSTPPQENPPSVRKTTGNTHSCGNGAQEPQTKASYQDVCFPLQERGAMCVKSRQVGKQTHGTRGKEKCKSSMWWLVHAHSCLTHCDPMDCSPPGSSV